MVAGGPCACNAEPLADFFDLFSYAGEVQLRTYAIPFWQGRKAGLQA